MDIEFKKVSEFERGILFDILKDAYSFNQDISNCFRTSWLEFDDFFFNNLNIADSCGFITTIDSIPIGFISWNPTKKPEFVEIGHNAIRTAYKGLGYGKRQLQEALNRIGNFRVIVSTNKGLVPAVRMYESVGFRLIKEYSELEIYGVRLDYAIEEKK